MSNTKIEKSVLQFHVNDLLKFELYEKGLLDKRLSLLSKRAFDITFAILLIIIFFPVFLISIILIKITSQGPILYSNYRVGLKGEYFRCYKFRSMHCICSNNSDDGKKAKHYQQFGILYKEQNDRRITAIGKLMRKTSIDELPQLLNVIKGDMSIVGPRPLIPFMLEPHPEFSAIRSLVKPGITGLWQIRERERNTSAIYMMRHDMEYIINYNFLLDLLIICSTVKVVASGKGAY